MNHIKQTDYSESSLKVPRYRYVRIPLNNINTLVYQPNSSTLAEFKVPASVCANYARSFVGIQLPFPALGAGIYNIIFDEGVTAFRSVYFGPSGGLGIVDMPFSDVWTNLMLPYRTAKQDVGSDQLTAMYRCEQLQSSNLLPFSRDGLLVGTQNASSTPYSESQYLRISSAANAATTLNKLYPLNSFVDTFLAQDVDTVFGTDMYLRFQTNMLTRMFYGTTVPNNPSLNNNAQITEPTNTVNAANVYLYLAVEENLLIRNSLLASLSSGGLKFKIPNTVCYRQSAVGTSNSANVTLSLNKSNGAIMKRIVNAFYNGNEFTQHAYNHANVNGTKVNTFSSSLNSRPLQDYNQNIYNSECTINPNNVWATAPVPADDDYREHRAMIKGTAIDNYNVYQTNWLWCDSWGVPAFVDDKQPMIWQNNDGLDMMSQGDILYSLSLGTQGGNVATMDSQAAGYLIYMFPTFVRELSILPSGISLSA